MIGAHPSEVVRVVCVLLSPLIAMFGLYVIVHGHYGPGGGFAGGVFVAVGAILPRLTLPEPVAFGLVGPSFGPLAAGIGSLLFLLSGLAPMLFGGAFLDHGAIEVAGVEPARVRYLGILVVEVAVGLAVFGAMLLIFDVITGSLDRGGGPDGPGRPDPEPREAPRRGGPA